MKINIRRSVFETNSSSTHSLSITSKEKFEKWENKELVFNIYDDKFVTHEDAKKDIESNDTHSDESDYQTYEEYSDDDDLEYFEEEHETENGDKIVAFGRYGYDG